MKGFVGSTVNVILTRQTCGQRSSRAAESKRRALGNFFFGQICYMFLISKCRGDWDLGLCTTSGLAFGEPQRSGDFREKNVFRRWENRILTEFLDHRVCGNSKKCVVAVVLLEADQSRSASSLSARGSAGHFWVVKPFKLIKILVWY